MNPLRESVTLLCVLFAGFFGWVLTFARSGPWNVTGMRHWVEAIRNADTEGGATWALVHSFPWLPTVTLWPFTVFAETRSPLAPAAVSCFFAAAVVASAWFRLRRSLGAEETAGVLFLLLVNPLFMDIALTGDFRAPMLLLWYVMCASARGAQESGDARSFLSIAGLAGMMWFCDPKLMLMMIPFVPLTWLVLPLRVIQASPAGGYLVMFFPSLVAFGAVLWVALVMPGRGSAVTDWSVLPVSAGGLLYCLLACGIVAAPFFHPAKNRLYLTLFALPLAAGCLNLAFSPDPQPLFFAGLLLSPLLLWAESSSLRRNRLALVASAFALWMIPVAQNTGRFEVDRELGEWLRAHGTSSVLADDRTLGAALAFSRSAHNLVLPGTTAYEIQTSLRTPDTDFVVTPGPAPRDPADRVLVRYQGAYSRGFPGYRLVFDNGNWRVWGRVKETHQVAAAY